LTHNHFATFRCGLGFLKFLTFSWWSLPMFENLAEGGKLGLTDFIGFWKIWKKIGEIQENLAETHRRR
jgi:hypothetical protein